MLNLKNYPSQMTSAMRIFLRLLSILVLIILAALMAFYYFLPGIHSSRDIQLGSNKQNAVWAAHEWVGAPQSRERIHTLLSTLMTNNISIAFVHSGPISNDGTIPTERYQYAKRFLEIARQIAPDMEFHAWIGQVRSKLPIENEEVVQNIIKDAHILIEKMGFDGIHLNIEPMQADPQFLHVIKELRAALNNMQTISGKAPILSAAISPIVPKTALKLLQMTHKETFFGHDLYKSYNTLGDTKKLAEYVDYLALMAYDTSFKDLDLYQWFVEQELIFLTHAAPRKAIFGIPSYEDERPNFDATVENMENALIGVHNGLRNIRVNPKDLVGLSVYARWTTDEDEWGTWQKKWLGETN